MTVFDIHPFLRHGLCDRHRRVWLDPLCHLLASRLRHAAIQSLRSPQGAFFLLYYCIQDHHLHHHGHQGRDRPHYNQLIDMIMIIKTATRWCKNINIARIAKAASLKLPEE